MFARVYAVMDSSSYTATHLKQRAQAGAAATSSRGASLSTLTRDRTAYIKYLESELSRFAEVAAKVGDIDASMCMQVERFEALEDQLKAQGKLVGVVQKFNEEIATGHRRDFKSLERKIAAATEHLALEPVFGDNGAFMFNESEIDESLPSIFANYYCHSYVMKQKSDKMSSNKCLIRG